MLNTAEIVVMSTLSKMENPVDDVEVVKNEQELEKEYSRISTTLLIDDNSANMVKMKISKSRSIGINAIFFFFGAVTLLSWTAFVTNTQYFKSRVVSEPNLLTFFDPSLVLCSMVPLLIGNAMNVLLLNNINQTLLIIVSLIVILIGFAGTSVLVYTSANAITFFAIIMVLAFLLNLVSPILQASYLTQITYFDQSNLTYYLAGFPFSGIFVAVIQIIVVSLGISDQLTALIYFLITLGFVLLCLLLYIYLLKSKEFMVGKQEFEAKNISNIVSEVNVTYRGVLRNYGKVFRMRWLDLISMSLTFITTFGYWPTVIIKIESIYINTIWADKYFANIFCFLTFAVFDLVGRNLKRFIPWPKLGSFWILFVCLIRILFLFLFLLCNRPHATGTVFPNIFNHDIAPFIFLAIWSWAYGHLLVLLFSTPYVLTNALDIKNCNTLVVLFIGIGSSVGGFVSFGFALL